MKMEPIKGTTASYQGSGIAVEEAQSAPKAEIKAAVVPDQTSRSSAGEDSRPADQTMAPEQASDSSLKNAVEKINRNSANMEAVFGYHEGTHRVTIKIVDKDTKEVKREYPAEKTLDMIQKIWEMAGLMVDEKR